MKKLALSILTLALLITSGCASLKSVSMSQVPQNRTQPIQAESWTWGIFGIYFTNSFVDEAVDELKSKCTNGKVSGVFTKYEGRHYFLWTTRTIKAQAYCDHTASSGAGTKNSGAKI